MCFANVTRPFGVHCIIIEKHTLSPTPHGTVAQPWLAFIPLWTVYRHTFIITPDSPECITDNLIQSLVRTAESSGMFHFIFYYLGNEIFSLRIRITTNFYIAKSMIDKTRCPGSIFCFTSTDNIHICRTGIPEISGVKFTVALQTFCETEADTVTSLSFNSETYPSCHILTDIQDIFIAELFNGNRFQRFCDFHTRHHLRTQCSRRNAHTLCRHPAFIIIPGLSPVS